MHSTCAKNSLIRPYNGLKEYKDNPDIPDKRADVANIIASITPDVTGDVVNNPHNHISSLVGVVNNETADVANIEANLTPDHLAQGVTSVLLSHTLVGGVINTNPIHEISINLG